MWFTHIKRRKQEERTKTSPTDGRWQGAKLNFILLGRFKIDLRVYLLERSTLRNVASILKLHYKSPGGEKRKKIITFCSLELYFRNCRNLLQNLKKKSHQREMRPSKFFFCFFAYACMYISLKTELKLYARGRY